MATNVMHRPTVAPVRFTRRAKRLAVAAVLALAAFIGIAWPDSPNPIEPDLLRGASIALTAPQDLPADQVSDWCKHSTPNDAAAYGCVATLAP